MTRAAVVAIALCLSACGPPPGEEIDDADIVALDAIALRAQLAAGRLTAERVTQAYLSRIAALDDAGPRLNAVIEINPEALDIARDLDSRLAVAGPVGALHGVPVLIKANIDTADRMATTAGSLALAEHFAAEDAEVVARLRAAGAVVLGKTNLSEWANFRSTQSISGWSSIGGQTHNPYVLDRNPCGSSSGSAVAVAARLAPLAVGTETDGSIVCPAAASGVVGIKPAAGTVSQRGIVPIAASQDTAGPLARTVADAALLLAVLTDDADPGAWTPDADVMGLRIGVVRDYGGAGRDAAVEAAFSATLRSLEIAGATLIDPVEARFLREVADAERAILLAEFRDGINSYLAGVERGPRTLDELIAFNDEHAAQVMPHFGQELLLESRDTGGRSDATYTAAVEIAAAARVALAELFAVRDLDALVAPTNGRAWRNDAQGAGRVGSSRIAAVSGYASMTVPIDVSAELPLGVALIVRPGDEKIMLTIGAVLEKLRGPFPEPRFLPSIGD